MPNNFLGARMKKVFLGGPFKGCIDPNTNLMTEEYKRKFINLINFFEERGYEIHNAHKRESWGEFFWEPEDCTKLDYEEIYKADVFIAFPGSPASPGTHIEIGWASALGKKIILLLEKEKYYAHLIKGLHMIADVHFIYYQQSTDYIHALEKLFPVVEVILN